jgi:hypothetical protein
MFVSLYVGNYSLGGIRVLYERILVVVKKDDSKPKIMPFRRLERALLVLQYGSLAHSSMASLHMA